MDSSSSQRLTGALRSIDGYSSTFGPFSSSVDAPTSLHRTSSAKRNLKQGSWSFTALSTPHDRILEKVYNVQDRSEGGLPLASELGATSLSLLDGSNTNYKSRSLNEPVNFLASPTTSFTSNPSLTARLFEPFDGSPLGIIVPVESVGHEGESMPANSESSHDEMWSHLSRVLDLQHQIARMHVELEGVALGKQPDGKGKSSLGNSLRATGFPRPRTASASSVTGGDIEDEETVGAVDDEAEKLRAREREFKKLATQFQGRKEAIDAMMVKVGSSTLQPPTKAQYLQLDNLAQALTDFHSLQTPKMECSNPSRDSSLNSTSTGDSHHEPIIIPPSDITSPMNHAQSSAQSFSVAMRSPTSYHLQPTVHNGSPEPPPNPMSDIHPFLQSKETVPKWIINLIELGFPTHVVIVHRSTSLCAYRTIYLKS